MALLDADGSEGHEVLGGVLDLDLGDFGALLLLRGLGERDGLGLLLGLDGFNQMRDLDALGLDGLSHARDFDAEGVDAGVEVGVLLRGSFDLGACGLQAGLQVGHRGGLLGDIGAEGFDFLGLAGAGLLESIESGAAGGEIIAEGADGFFGLAEILAELGALFFEGDGFLLVLLGERGLLDAGKLGLLEIAAIVEGEGRDDACADKEADADGESDELAAGAGGGTGAR